MYAPELKNMLKMFIGMQMPVHIEGLSGSGKSEIVYQVAAEISAERNSEFGVKDVRAILMNPVDANGLPHMVAQDGEPNGLTVWSRPDTLPSSGCGILFYDELTQADPDVQKALYSVILDRRIGDHKLGDGWSIASAGNLASEKAATYGMLGPLANRMAHLKLDISVPAWCDWGALNGINPILVAFHKFRIGADRRPNENYGLLHRFDSKSTEKAWPSPRSWYRSNKILNYVEKNKLDDSVLLAGITANVGEYAAVEFMGFRDIVKTGFSADDVLNNPSSANIPASPAVCYAISSYLSRMMNNQNIGAIMIYLRRMEQEYMMMTMLEAAKNNPVICSTSVYQKFALEFQHELA